MRQQAGRESRLTSRSVARDFLERLPEGFPALRQGAEAVGLALGQVQRFRAISLEVVKFPGLTLRSDDFPLALSEGAVPLVLPPEGAGRVRRIGGSQKIFSGTRRSFRFRREAGEVEDRGNEVDDVGGSATLFR